MRLVLLVTLALAACGHKAKPAQTTPAGAGSAEAAPAQAAPAPAAPMDDAKKTSRPGKTSGDPCEGGQ